MSTLTGRMNTLLLVVVIIIGLAIIAMLATGVRGGPLDPPSAPAPTDGVRDAGTPISSLPFTISAPGRYYVTRDLTGVGGQNGVTISANDVTLDLNGFTLHGVGQTGDGVLVSGTNKHVSIEHASVRGWYNGIDAQLAVLSRISRVDAIYNGQASNDGSVGIFIGSQSVIEDCNVSNNQATGIRAGDIAIRNCRVSANGNDGIYAASGVHLDHNDVRFNSAGAFGWFDVRFIGGNFASENFIRAIAFDRTASPSSNIVVRNAYCAASNIGGLADFDSFPASGAEFNGGVAC